MSKIEHMSKTNPNLQSELELIASYRQNFQFLQMFSFIAPKVAKFSQNCQATGLGEDSETKLTMNSSCDCRFIHF